MASLFPLALPLLAFAIGDEQPVHRPRGDGEDADGRANTLKIVYCGPGAGPAESLRRIDEHLPPDKKRERKTDSTLLSDTLTIEVGTNERLGRTVTLRLHLATTSYAATQKVLVKDVDGIVFVASAAPDVAKTNEQAFAALKSDLAEWGYDRENVPLVLQVMGTEIPGARDAVSVAASLGAAERPVFLADPTTGTGVTEALAQVIRDAASRRAQVAGHDYRVILSLRTIVSAQAAYSESNNGFYDSRLECLAAPSDCLADYSGLPFMDGNEVKSVHDGYYFQMFSKTARQTEGQLPSRGRSSTSATGYAVVAWPVTRGAGARTFCADSCGIICAVSTAAGRLLVEEVESKPWVHCAWSCLALP